MLQHGVGKIYCFDRIVLIFGYVVERTNTKMLSSHFLQFPSSTQITTTNDVISDFAQVVVERCDFHHWIAQTISCGEVVSVFLYLL